MKKYKFFIIAFLSIGLVFTAHAISAATTIGTNITTEGTMNVSGHSAFGGATIDQFGTVGAFPILNNNGATLTTNTNLIGVASFNNLDPVAAYTSTSQGGNFRSQVVTGNTQDFSDANLKGISAAARYGGINANNPEFVVTGADFDASNDSTGRVGYAIGTYSAVYNNAAGTIDTGVGVNSNIENEAGGTITETAAFNANILNSGSGTIGTAHGFLVSTPTNGGVITTNYGTYIQDQSGVSGIGTSYNLYSEGTNSLNIFDGRIGIGTITPSQALEVDGGMMLNTATAKPTCDSTTRGTFWFTQGAPAVKDNVEVCAKDAVSAYAWRTIY